MGGLVGTLFRPKNSEKSSAENEVLVDPSLKEEMRFMFEDAVRDEADGRQLFRLLTKGMDTLEKFHRVPLFPHDESWADPHELGISLVPGPNWDNLLASF